MQTVHEGSKIMGRVFPASHGRASPVMPSRSAMTRSRFARRVPGAPGIADVQAPIRRFQQSPPDSRIDAPGFRGAAAGRDRRRRSSPLGHAASHGRNCPFARRRGTLTAGKVSQSRVAKLAPPFIAASFVYKHGARRCARHPPEPRWTTSWPGHAAANFRGRPP